MNKEQISELYSYNQWANEKLLVFLGELTSEDYFRDLSGSFGSIHNTLVHNLGVEELWLKRWLGEQGQLLQPRELPSYKDLQERCICHNANMEQFLSSLTEKLLTSKISFTNTRGKTYTLELWKQMVNVPNHSAYHRGQIVHMLRQLEFQPPSTGLVYYYLGER